MGKVRGCVINKVLFFIIIKKKKDKREKREIPV